MDDKSYLCFIAPSLRDKAINTLEGIIKGISIDSVINESELTELKEWCADNETLLNKHPFAEIVPLVYASIADGRLEQEEIDDILWALKNSKSESSYFDRITADIQELQGILHGITADSKIEISELKGLHEWILAHDHLKGTYPYDEIESLIIGVLKDHVIDENEHMAILSFFNDFISYSLSKRINRELTRVKEDLDAELMLKQGFCSVDPVIEFKDKTFVFTGESRKMSRSKIAAKITEREGLFANHVSKTTHYLVVGNNGNVAWAFSCYGRKVEQAIQLRKKGEKILIVNEIDFWDAV